MYGRYLVSAGDYRVYVAVVTQKETTNIRKENILLGSRVIKAKMPVTKTKFKHL